MDPDDLGIAGEVEEDELSNGDLGYFDSWDEDGVESGIEFVGSILVDGERDDDVVLVGERRMIWDAEPVALDFGNVIDTNTDGCERRALSGPFPDHEVIAWPCEGCEGGRFIFLWIAFNVAYAHEIGDSERSSDKAAFVAFLNKICELDTDKRIGDLSREQLRDSTRLLGTLVPLIITLMMDNPTTLWGDAVYPVVERAD